MPGDYPKITLRAARVNAGLTQKTAAEKLNLNVRSLQKYENNETVPRWDTAKAMAELYGLSIDYIFFGIKTANSGFLD